MFGPRGEVRGLRRQGVARHGGGHGALAEKAVLPVIPTPDEFPYALRLVSEILGSNGSSSMASVCGSTLSMMDAGVPIKAPVAGVAMGLIKDTDSDKVAVLTDIQGLEDFLGDMDFKVTGTKDGITALQMDIKIKELSKEIMETALNQANGGRIWSCPPCTSTSTTSRVGAARSCVRRAAKSPQQYQRKKQDKTFYSRIEIGHFMPLYNS